MWKQFKRYAGRLIGYRVVTATRTDVLVQWFAFRCIALDRFRVLRRSPLTHCVSVYRGTEMLTHFVKPMRART